MKKLIRKTLKLFNLEIHWYRPNGNATKRIVNILNHFNAEIVIDVGANEGQFAKALLANDFKENIISIEPLRLAHLKLRNSARRFSNWTVYKKCGFGTRNTTANINVSKNSVSSSILKIKNKHLELVSDSKVISKEKIKLITLDTFFKDKKIYEKKIFVKIDTQGYEKRIIEGAKNSLKNIMGFIIETSIIKLYEGETLWVEIVKYLEKLGYKVWSIERGFSNKKTMF